MIVVEYYLLTFKNLQNLLYTQFAIFAKVTSQKRLRHRGGGGGGGGEDLSVAKT